jgi:hypothetical protein
VANAHRDLADRVPHRTRLALLLAPAFVVSLSGCAGMAEREVAGVAAPPGVLTEAGTDQPARKRDPDGQCLACFPGLFQMPLFGLR